MSVQTIANILTSLLLSFLLLVASASQVVAEDISFDADVVAEDQQVTLRLKNSGVDTAKNITAVLSLAGEDYQRTVATELAANETRVVEWKVELPKKPGTYSLVTRIYYFNGNTRLTLLNVGYFNYQSSQQLTTYCDLPTLHLGEELTQSFRCDNGKKLHFVFPDEVKVLKQENTKDGVLLQLKNLLPGFRSTYPYYAVLESDESIPIHATAIFSGQLITRPSIGRDRVLLGTVFGVVSIFGLLFSYFYYQRVSRGDLSSNQVALTRWGFSVFVVSALLAAYELLYLVPDYLLSIINPNWFSFSGFTRWLWLALKSTLEWLYFRGANYDYFSSYVVLPLFLYFVFGNYFTLRYLIKPDPRSDKYWHLMLAVFSILPQKNSPVRSLEFKSGAKVAALSLVVKAFYVPLLCSWTISNIFYQLNLLSSFEFTFQFVNKFLLATIILVDVSIFAFGYLIELPQLKNQIRSVESTVLGWTVCLMCYPPFNEFAFKYFDYPLQDHWGTLGEIGNRFAAVVTLLLWLIYVWASVALGAKASNLTNRGIVDSGPYKYVRHPAYVAKVAVWTVESFFLGSKNFFLILSLFVVYGLRAWTEERHLSQDPDYLVYKSKVKWRFIPKVI